MRIPRSGTRTEHLRRAADCVRADLPPAVLLTVVVRHGATRHGVRNGRHGCEKPLFEAGYRLVSFICFAISASSILAGRSLGRVQFLKRCGMTAWRAFGFAVV